MSNVEASRDQGLWLLLKVMQRLRDPVHGCPWDLKQTFESIVPYTIEEAWEVADAVHGGDREHLKEELGDLLLQVVFQSQLAAEEGAFTFHDVANEIVAKLLRRHPHVFPDGTLNSRTDIVLTAEEVKERWNQIKDQEKQHKKKDQLSALDGVKAGLPPITRALHLQKKASKVNFDWSDTRKVLFQLREEIDEFEESFLADDGPGMLDELGDVLFSVVNLARHSHIDSEQALLHGNNKFEARFRVMERLSGQPLDTFSLEEQEVLWSRAKDHLAVLEEGGNVVPKNELKFQLQRLKESLHSIDKAEPELQDTLLTLSSEIDRILVKDEDVSADTALIEALEAESVKFSIDHPTISAVINEVVSILARMGI